MSGYTGSLIIGWLNYCFYPVSLWIKRYRLVYNQSELWYQSFLLLHQCGALEVKNTVLHFSAFVISISYCTGQKASSHTLEKNKTKRWGNRCSGLLNRANTHRHTVYEAKKSSICTILMSQYLERLTLLFSWEWHCSVNSHSLLRRAIFYRRQ